MYAAESFIMFECDGLWRAGENNMKIAVCFVRTRGRDAAPLGTHCLENMLCSSPAFLAFHSATDFHDDENLQLCNHDVRCMSS